ncbi:MAG: phage head closure protein [Pirellulales bacterium]
MIRPGRMRERVTVQAMTETANDLGEVERSYTDVKTIWADVRAQASFEQRNNNKLELQSTYNVKIRYTPDITPTTRLLWKTKSLEVTSILERFDSSVLELIAVEVQ